MPPPVGSSSAADAAAAANASASLPLLQHDSVAGDGPSYVPEMYSDGSCCSNLRLSALRLIQWPLFDFFILFVIISSCVVMATLSPARKAEIEGTPTAAMYAALEDVFTYIFTAEVMTKLLALGMGRYFADGWNIFDFLVVSTAWLQRLPGVGNYTALRAVRVLRALRMVNRVPSLKRIISSLLDSLPELSNVATLFAMFVFLMSIVGVNLYEGKMHYRCTLPATETQEATMVGDHELCNVDADCEAPATCVYWEVTPEFGAVSYDNVGAAFATIFQAVTLEGWVDQMYMLRRTAGETSPVIFYLILVIVGSNFIVNLFLAVLFDSFNGAQAKIEGGAEAAAAPPNVATRGRAVSMWSQNVFCIPQQCFDTTIYVMIVLNTIVMCSNYYGESELYRHLLDYANDFFVAAFTIEMLLKLCSGGRAYFTSYWNRFDFIVTWCSLVDVTLEQYGHDTDFLRALRVARVLRLLRLNPQMVRFERTAAAVASLVLNLSAVLVLIMIVFAMLGMELFGGKLGDEPPRAHFDDFGSAFVTIFTLTSGEDWNAVFASTLEAGMSWPLAAGYFLPMFVINNYVLVNLFVAIICWGWESVNDEEDGAGAEAPEAAMPTANEEQERLRRHKASLESGLKELRTQHLELSKAVRKLSTDGHFGLTKADGTALCVRLEASLNEFVAAANAAPAEQAADTASLTKGFHSLCDGQRKLLGALSGTAGALPAPDALGEVAWPEPPTRLLFEYWDSAHALGSAELQAAVESGKAPAVDVEAPRAVAPLSGLKPVVSKVVPHTELENLMRAHVVSLLLYPTVASDLREIRLAERERRAAEAAARTARAQKSMCPCSADMPLQLLADDGLGRTGLPLAADPGAGIVLRAIRTTVSSPAFETVILLCIFFSSAALAFDMPSVVPGSQTAEVLALLDVTFTSIFLLEMLLKVLAFGLLGEPDGYLRSWWNLLDASIVTTSVLSLVLSDAENLSALRAMRALRALRPLRAIRRLSGIRKVVNSLLRAMPQVGHVAQVCGLVFIVYGLFGMQFLMGRMARCTDGSINIKRECVGEWVDPEDGLTKPRWWGNEDLGNFDNLGMATLTLFELSSLEMWPDVLWRAMDSDPVGHDVGPEHNANKGMAAYIISWIVLSNFILLNLFVGVVLENFNAIRKMEDGSGFMSDAQKEWALATRSIFTVKSVRRLNEPEGKGCVARFRRRVFKLIYDDATLAMRFERTVACLVLLNVLSMAVTWYRQPHWIDIFTDGVDWFFTAAFTIEMLLKMMGFGLCQYLSDNWNVLDCSLVSMSLLDHALTLLAAGGLFISPTILRMLRFFRIVRLLKLIKVAPGIKRLLTTVIVSAPSLANVGVLLLLVMYIYSILGVELFSHLQHGEFIDDDANFETFGAAMLTMVRCITGESYNGIMHDAMVTEANSEPGRCSDAEGTCGNPLTAVAFFISFVIIGSYVMLNVFIAVILDAFAEDQATDQMEFNQQNVDDFVEVWQRFDPVGNHLVPTKDLDRLMRSLREPVGFRKKVESGEEDVPTNYDVSSSAVMKRIKSLGLKDLRGQVAFHDMLEALGRMVVGKGKAEDLDPPGETEAAKALNAQKEATAGAYEGIEKSYTPRGRHEITSEQMLALLKLQNATRQRLRRKGKAVSGSTEIAVGMFDQAAADALEKKRLEEEAAAAARAEAAAERAGAPGGAPPRKTSTKGAKARNPRLGLDKAAAASTDGTVSTHRTTGSSPPTLPPSASTERAAIGRGARVPRGAGGGASTGPPGVRKPRSTSPTGGASAPPPAPKSPPKPKEVTI